MGEQQGKVPTLCRRSKASAPGEPARQTEVKNGGVWEAGIQVLRCAC